MVGDVLVMVGSARVESIDDLQRALDGLGVGSQVAVIVGRGGDRKEVTVEVGERTHRGCR